MALQKWAAPAGSPLLATVTANNAGGQAIFSVTFASDGDIAIGAVLKIRAVGTITTTGAPTLNVVVSGPDNAGYATATAAAPTDVTGQTWSLDATVTVRSSVAAAYDVSTSGLFAAPTHDVSVVTISSLVGAWGLTINLDTADAGDSVSIIAADALWIG